MKKVILITLLFLMACTNEIENPLYGTWAADSTKYIGSLVITIDEETFSYGVILQIDTNRYGMEMHGGHCEQRGNNTIRVTYELTTCPESVTDMSELITYSINGDKLTLTMVEGSIILYRMPDSDSQTSGTVVENGCWEGGIFTPHELTRI